MAISRRIFSQKIKKRGHERRVKDRPKSFFSLGKKRSVIYIEKGSKGKNYLYSEDKTELEETFSSKRRMTIMKEADINKLFLLAFILSYGSDPWEFYFNG